MMLKNNHTQTDTQNILDMWVYRTKLEPTVQRLGTIQVFKGFPHILFQLNIIFLL